MCNPSYLPGGSASTTSAAAAVPEPVPRSSSGRPVVASSLPKPIQQAEMCERLHAGLARQHDEVSCSMNSEGSTRSELSGELRSMCMFRISY